MNQRQPRIRDEAHLKYIRQKSCCICGDNVSVEAAHIRAGNWKYGKPKLGMAQKSDDCWTVPLCGRHHREQHTMEEIFFWKRHAIDPFKLAKQYYDRHNKDRHKE